MTQAGFAEHPNEAELRDRIETGSSDPEDYLDLAELLKSALRFREALELYERGFSLNLSKTASARFAWELGSLQHGMLGGSTEAIALAQRALSLLADEPVSREVLLLRGLSHGLIARALETDEERARSEASRAAEHLERVLAEHATSDATAVAYLELAWLYRLLGEPDKMIGCCQAYLSRNIGPRERALALGALADAFRLAGRLTEAEKAMEEALGYAGRDLAADRPALQLTMGLIQRAAGKPAEARRSLETTLSALREFGLYGNPDLQREREIDVYWHLAELHCETGNYPEAVSVLTKLLAMHPGDRHRECSLLRRAWCYVYMGLPNQARRDYKQVLASPTASDEERAAARDGLAELPPANS